MSQLYVQRNCLSIRPWDWQTLMVVMIGERSSQQAVKLMESCCSALVVFCVTAAHPYAVTVMTLFIGVFFATQHAALHVLQLKYEVCSSQNNSTGALMNSMPSPTFTCYDALGSQHKSLLDIGQIFVELFFSPAAATKKSTTLNNPEKWWCSLWKNKMRQVPSAALSSEIKVGSGFCLLLSFKGLSNYYFWLLISLSRLWARVHRVFSAGFFYYIYMCRRWHANILWISWMWEICHC